MNIVKAKRKMSNKEYAIIAITKNGVKIAKQLHQDLADSDLYYPNKFANDDEKEKNIFLYDNELREVISKIYNKYQGIIMFMATGAVVRLIAPYLTDKKTDPAIVVVDGMGNYAISLLSGHIGGGNYLTKEVARIINAKPVITTASDVQETIAVDMLGRQFGFEIESFENATKVSAAVVNEEKVAIIQETGEKNWWQYSRDLPANFNLFSSISEVSFKEFSSFLLITDRLLTEADTPIFLKNCLLYRPKSLVIGIGCNRGTPVEEIEQVIFSTLEKLNLSWKSVRNLATINIKDDEEGLIKVSEKYSWPFKYYTPKELNKAPIKTPSLVVYKHTGAYGVSEPAALLSAGTDNLLLEKLKDGNVTISIARVPFQ